MRKVQAPSVALIVLGAVIACSRVSNQTNFIGAPCRTEADCPSELTCHQGQTCQERCVNGNACSDATKVCVNGACVSGPATPPGTDPGGSGDPGPQTPPGSNPNGPDPNEGGPSGKGETILDNLKAQKKPDGIAAGGGYVAFVQSGQDQFGATVNQLEVVATAAGSTPVDVATLTSAPLTTFVHGGALYWVDDSGGADALKKFPLPSGPEQPVLTFLENEARSATIAGEYLFTTKVGGAGAGLRRYSLATGTFVDVVDPTPAKFPTPRGPVAWVATDGTNLYWVHEEAPGSPYPIFKGLLGSGTGSATASTLPANSQVAFFAMSGTDAIVAFNATSLNFFRFDTTATGSGTPLFTLPSAGPHDQVPIAGDHVYVFASSGGSNAIRRYSLTSGAATTVVDFGTYQDVSGVTVDATNVYWFEQTSMSDDPGAKPTGTYRLAKQAHD